MVAEPEPNQQAFAVRLGPIDELRPPVTNDPIVDYLYLNVFELERDIYARRRHGVLKGIEGLGADSVQWIACQFMPIRDLEPGKSR